MTTMDVTAARAKVGEQLCTSFFDDDARCAPGFRNLLAKQVDRVIETAKIFGDPLGYDDLNAIRADGVMIQGLFALGLVDANTASRWHARMARFMEAIAGALPNNDQATVGEVLTEADLEAKWEATA